MTLQRVSRRKLSISALNIIRSIIEILEMKEIKKDLILKSRKKETKIR